MARRPESGKTKDINKTKLDDAARAGWLYYVAGNTQDEIASKLGVSRQTAQRLVSLAVSEKLVKVRLDHPIAQCMDYAARLQAAYGLDEVEVVPSDPGHPDTTLGIAEAVAARIEKILSASDPVTMGIGTGRTLKAAVEQLSFIDCPHHFIVSLAGNIAPDGSAAFYNVVFNLANKVSAPSFPMPLPVIAASAGERALLHEQAGIGRTLALAQKVQIAIVGVGDLGPSAPLYEDGFVTLDELKALQNVGAVGEILGWTFDAEGRVIEGMINERVASARLPDRDNALVIAAAKGGNKVEAIRAALRRRLVNGLITDEDTARALLG
ncbi:sugar-binding transcriptional regulator [Pelagibacterium xiamenense]|uniref:sugar-binding transcriptional regulator n=1 Tax=Pelagibacterium xiamenense TaxID=2901140 RepID=UPI001E302B3D|nr:sugar-binding transcriptional regulator [Pelagibacterium xiamenense]MCD7058787.1 sugar-binding transcriptional regulator [Pelagibacterium xiamenense]